MNKFLRKIKFRAWNKKHKRMMKVDHMYFSTSSVKCNGNLGKYGFNEVELMQFTSLKDKNGKEIYEGDICKLYYGRDGTLIDIFDVYFAPEYAAFIRRDKEAPVVGGKKHYSIDDGFLHETHTIEIIGNIYENPDLLINKLKVLGREQY